MKTVYDVKRLLHKFESIIYIGDRAAEWDLMAVEIMELYQHSMLDSGDYQRAI